MRETKDYSEKKTGNHREALKLLVLKTLFTSWQIKETLFIHLCNEYVLCLERFDEREQSITRNVIWIVIQKKKMIKVTGIKRGKTKKQE